MPRTFSALVFRLFPAVILLLVAETATAGCGKFCRGSPLDFCNSFWVLESTYLTRSGESELRGADSRFQLGLELGHMKNISPKSSVGGSLYLSLVNEELFGVKGRYRYWFNPKTSLDISPGILVAGSTDKADITFPGFVCSVTINYKDWVGLTLQLQALRYQSRDDLLGTTHDGAETDLYIGTRFGSYPALAWPLMTLVVAALTLDDWEFNPRD